MKENTKIEDLFRQKFENFQPEVDPAVWANVQAGLGVTTSAATGISAALKIGLISGGIVAASVATWYFGFYEPEQSTTPVVAEQMADNIADQESATHNNEPIIVVDDTNDPVIIENRETIEQELRNYQNNQNTVSGVSVNNNNNVSNGTQPYTTPNSSNQNTNHTANTPAGVDQTTNNDVDRKDPIPSGRMELSQTSAYAPVVVTMVSNATNFDEVVWDFGDGQTGEGAEVKHTYNKPGKYIVSMTVLSGKVSYEESQEVVVKSRSSIDNVPNVITPNGDRINDVFSIRSTDIETFHIVITDNRGNEIFSSNDKDFTWDGTDYSGETVEKGIYTYIIIAEGKDGGVIKLPGQIYVQ